MSSAESLSLCVIIARRRSRVGPSRSSRLRARRLSSATSSIAFTTLADGYTSRVARPRSRPRVSTTPIETRPPRRRAKRHALLIAAALGIAGREPLARAAIALVPAADQLVGVVAAHQPRETNRRAPHVLAHSRASPKLACFRSWFQVERTWAHLRAP